MLFGVNLVFDIDPYAVAAITLNAEANGVAIAASPGEALDGDGDDADLVLAGDVLYSEAIAQRMWPFLHRARRAVLTYSSATPGGGICLGTG